VLDWNPQGTRKTKKDLGDAGFKYQPRDRVSCRFSMVSSAPLSKYKGQYLLLSFKAIKSELLTASSRNP
jgi:hypothetical protein